MVALTAVFLFGCGDDPVGNRFAGKTALEMHSIVRNLICDINDRCPREVGPMTREECIASASIFTILEYQSAIDEATREQLDACLTVLAAASCNEIKTMRDSYPSECTSVAKYIDL